MNVLSVLCCAGFTIYFIKLNYPDMYEKIKFYSLICILRLQVMLEILFVNCSNYYKIWKQYVRKSLNKNVKIFSNEHIESVDVVVYDLQDDETPKKRTFNFTNKALDLVTGIVRGTINVIEINFDNYTKVCLVNNEHPVFEKPSFKLSEILYDIIEKESAGGYFTPVESPFMCVEVKYNDNKYDITQHIKNYMYTGNVILNHSFIRMIMYTAFKTYIPPNSKFSLHTIDKNVNFNTINFSEDNIHGSYAYEIN